jgi:hypothetical protein
MKNGWAHVLLHVPLVSPKKGGRCVNTMKEAAMSLTAMWSHGNSVIVETPENLASDRRFGFGADMQIKVGKDCWIHASMPTPVILGGRRPKLVRVLILFTTGKPGGAGLKELHIFDGNNRIHVHSQTAAGEHLTLSDANIFALPSLQLSFALGISMRWQHSLFFPANAPSQQIFIAALGADYEFPG